MDTNKVWVGTFNLVWNDFMNEVIKGKIEFEDGESELANELNKQTFTVIPLEVQKKMLNILDLTKVEVIQVE